MPPWYSLLLIVGVALSTLVWTRLRTSRDVPPLVFIGALLGAVFGAKLVYLVVEWPFTWNSPDTWWHALYGRTVLGGLLGGYAGVELAKRSEGYAAPTGDGFALTCALGLAVGRVGCWLHGCCRGVVCDSGWYTIAGGDGLSRWPSQLLEAGFNLAFAGAALLAIRRRILPGQWFHLYLIAYGVFRLLHEPMRETTWWTPWLSAYQFVAIVLVLVGVWRFRVRQRRRLSPSWPATGDAARH